MDNEARLKQFLDGKYFYFEEDHSGKWVVRSKTSWTQIFSEIQNEREAVNDRDWLHVSTDIFDNITVEKIVQATCMAFNFTKQEITSSRRLPKLVLARQIGMWFAKNKTSRSYPEIGRRFGGKDHSTVMHACHKIESRKVEFAVMIAKLEQAAARLERSSSTELQQVAA